MHRTGVVGTGKARTAGLFGLSGVLAVVAVAVLGVPPAAACSCVEMPPPQEALAASGTVFAGRVTALGGRGLSGGSAHRPVAFEVAEVWAGAVHEREVVFTGENSAMCGYEFQVGGDYLVYASEDQGRLETGLCTRTTLLADADEDLAALGTAHPPLPGGVDVGTVGGRGRPGLWAGLAVALIGAVLVAGLFVRRRDGQP